MFDILVGDDSEGFVALLREAMRLAELEDRLHAVRNGQQVIQYLEGKGTYAEPAVHPFPNYVLLELYTPVLDGFEVVKAVRANQRIKHVPLHLWSGSATQRDVDRAYALGATSFQLKPATLIGLTETLTRLHRLHEVVVADPGRPPESGSNDRESTD